MTAYRNQATNLGGVGGGEGCKEQVPQGFQALNAPALHLLAGPNGSGKTAFYEHVLGPVTHLPFINADVIAREQWPGSDRDRSYEAAKIAEERGASMIAQGRSFIAETVFSHPSKLDLIKQGERYARVWSLLAMR